LNLAEVVIIWVVVNLLIAIMAKVKNAGEDMEITHCVVTVIVASVVGHLCVMALIKLFYAIYTQNVDDALRQDF
jgi:hypothetical protein